MLEQELVHAVVDRVRFLDACAQIRSRRGIRSGHAMSSCDEASVKLPREQVRIGPEASGPPSLTLARHTGPDDERRNHWACSWLFVQGCAAAMGRGWAFHCEEQLQEVELRSSCRWRNRQTDEEGRTLAFHALKPKAATVPSNNGGMS